MLKDFLKKSIYAWMIKNAQGVLCSALTPHIELEKQTLLCTEESMPGM